MQLLRKAVAAVLGITPPVAFRLGREGSSSAGTKPDSRPAPVAPTAVATVPSAKAEDVAAPTAEPGDAATHADMERMVIDELGAEVVAEHENDTV